MALNKTMTFDLELKPGGIPPIIHASQGDIGRMFKANIYWDGSAATSYVSGATVNLRGKKPDKTVFDYTATLAGSMVTFETTEQMTIISGPVECELVFSNDGDIIASANFVLMVEESPYDPDAPSESVIPGIVDLIEDTIGGDVRDEVDALITAHPELMLQDNAVTTPKIASRAVTEGKIASNAVTTDKLATGAVTAAKVNADFLKTIENAYVTPEQFGAVGDGTTDDTAAFSNANSYCSANNIVLRGTGKKYKIARVNFSNISIENLWLYLPSTVTKEYGVTFTNCNLTKCKFESTNDKSPAWSGGTTLQSNITVLGTNTNIYRCEFKEIEALSLEGENYTVNHLKFVDCSTGINVSETSGAVLHDLDFDLIDFTDTELHHALYLSKNVKNVIVTDMVSKGSRYYPLHVYNSVTSEENPKNIVIRNVFCSGVVERLIACNGSNVTFDNVNTESQVTDRYYIGYGVKHYIKNSHVDTKNGCQIFGVDTAGNVPENELIFDNCTFNIGTYLLYPSTTGKAANLTIQNCITNGLKKISTGRKTKFISKNNIHINPGRFFDNSGYSTILFDVLFMGDTFVEPSNDIYYAYGGIVNLIDCYFEQATPGALFASRSSTASDTTINASNVTFSKSGNHILGSVSGFQNNVYNET